MKFGILRYRQQFMNIGDVFQSIGLENMYRKCGIPDQDIIYLEKAKLSEYEGEYVIVPMSANCDYWNESKMFPLSEKIIPLFFGFRCVDDFHLRHLEKYKYNTFFGCRDVYNMELLRKNGYKAYVSGCMSLQLGGGRKREKKMPTGSGKIFLVDAPKQMESYVPKELKSRIVRLTNKFWRYDLSLEEAAVFEETEARKRLELLQEEAELVVTCRLHCALPCLAMGIPVILTFEHGAGLDNRYSGYSDFIDMYTSDQFHQINWDQKSKDITEIQERQVRIFRHELDQLIQQYADKYELSNIFENSVRRNYYNGSGSSGGYLTQWEVRQFLENRTLEKNYLAYVIGRKLHQVHMVIWGAGDKGKWMFDRYCDSFKMCRSVIYVDSDEKKQGKVLNGIRILSPEVLDKYPLNDTIVIVATNHAYDQIAFQIRKNLVEKFGMEEGKTFFMLDKLNATARYFVDDSGTFGWMDEPVWN